MEFDRCLSHESKPSTADGLTQEMVQTFNLDGQLEELALWLAQTWKDDHPMATANSEDFNACILAVTTELAIAAKAVGGPVGLVILTGASSVAIRRSCWRVLSGDCA
ncbi:MAG: hypothetical protein HC881_03330 [Leptolyngbyaceae cyanobacterium SL_7_1]|nr:hypothetical protein [Leptolyngbyaceae cyanobacterium SL_7_1]